ncbi:MAG: IPT/TIG domain-containing protein [Hyphomicrobium sp.]
MAPPTVLAVSPNTGTTLGGTAVTITGHRIHGCHRRRLQWNPRDSRYLRQRQHHHRRHAGTHAAGLVDVVVTTPAGTGTRSQRLYLRGTADGHRRQPQPRARLSAVRQSPSPAPISTVPPASSSAAPPHSGVTVVNATTITAVTPAHPVGPVDVVVATPGGTGTGTNAYTYVAAPTVTGVSPNIGPIAGGTPVTITGTNFTGATNVTFGGSAATGVTVVNDTTITAVTPAHSAGLVDVYVTTPDGTGTGTNAYTFLGAPTVLSVSPNSGPTAGGTSSPSPAQASPALASRPLSSSAGLRRRTLPSSTPQPSLPPRRHTPPGP